MSDYRDLPEPIAAAVALLINADRKAHKEAHVCEHCGRKDTLNVRNAELHLIHVIRHEYLPDQKKVLA